VQEPPLKIAGDASRYDYPDSTENFSQAGALYRLMSESQKCQLIDNLAAVLATVPLAIQLRQLAQFEQADPDYGSRVAKRLDIGSAVAGLR